MRPTKEKVRSLIDFALKNNIPPKEDNFGRFYEMCYMSDGSEVVDKIYEPFTHWSTVELNPPKRPQYSTPKQQAVLPKQYLADAFKERRKKSKNDDWRYAKPFQSHTNEVIDFTKKAKEHLLNEPQTVPSSAFYPKVSRPGHRHDYDDGQGESSMEDSYSCNVLNDVIEHDYYAVGIINEAFGRRESRPVAVWQPRPMHRLMF